MDSLMEEFYTNEAPVYDTAFNLAFLPKVYQACSAVNGTEVKPTAKIIRMPNNSPIKRYKDLINMVFSFEYHAKTFDFNWVMDYFGTLNKEYMNIGGVIIPSEKGKLLRVEPQTLEYLGPYNSDSQVIYYKIKVDIEIELQKSLKSTPIYCEDFYFRHPNTGRKVRVQFSSEPSKYIGDEKYPNAVEIFDGLGFYTEDRPDLNVLDAVFIDEQGCICRGENAYIIYDDEVSCKSWKNIAFPKQGLVFNKE